VFAFQDTQGPVEIAFTDRHADIGGGPFASLDLAEHRDDPEAAVGTACNRAAATRAFVGEDGLPALRTVVRMHQVHGADVHVVDEAGAATDEVPVADALVTSLPGVVLLVRAADCVPVLLADPVAGVVGAVHSGRPGLAAGVVPAAVAAMRDLGATDLTAWVGPHVCGACYEVPDQLRAEVAAVVPEAYAETSWGTPALDIGAGVLAQLRSAGVAVHDASRCTVEDDDLFSYRRQGTASGRLAGLVWRRP
jgi:YfiH family protein